MYLTFLWVILLYDCLCRSGTWHVKLEAYPLFVHSERFGVLVGLKRTNSLPCTTHDALFVASSSCSLFRKTFDMRLSTSAKLKQLSHCLLDRVCCVSACRITGDDFRASIHFTRQHSPAHSSKRVKSYTAKLNRRRTSSLEEYYKLEFYSKE